MRFWQINDYFLQKVTRNYLVAIPASFSSGDDVSSGYGAPVVSTGYGSPSPAYHAETSTTYDAPHVDTYSAPQPDVGYHQSGSQTN